MKRRLLPLSLLALVRLVLADATLPYNPTRLLTASNSTYVYIFQQSPDSANQGVLKTVDLERELAARDVPTTTIASSLPFLQEDTLVPYVPVIDTSGNISVIAGSCGDSGSIQVWRFVSAAEGKSGNGSWSQYQTSGGEAGAGSAFAGVGFLSNAVGFSANVGGDAAELDFYIFAGMCPFDNSTSSTWQSTAQYSDSMRELRLGRSADFYDIANVATRGPPIAEAGFSMTGLTPTFRVSASGSAQTQQQDFLLLGGHTQDAFLNTSQVALFSLPQTSWSFLPVQQPSAARTDLALRQTATTIEPRSGHTAVLSEDGTQIIVLGGWVGDVNSPAQPQLAVLHLGSEYGGDEAQAWTWSVPDQSGVGLPSGSGIYGHGATMLPGGVMMVVGGYQIQSASSSRIKRQSQESILLYNTTSNSWIYSYANPNISGAAAGQSSSGGALSKTSQQTGLGVGLGLGVAVLIALIIFYFWYCKRLKRKREEQERALMVQSSDISVAGFEQDQPFLDRRSVDGRGGDPYAAVGQHQMSQQAGSTGLFTNVPSPARGLRKGLAARPFSYHAAPRYDDSRTAHGSGGIHPIMEHQDEEDTDVLPAALNPFQDPSPLREPEQAYDNYSTAEAKLQELQRVLHSATAVDVPARHPFIDPLPNPLGSHPTSPVVLDTFETVRRVPTQASRAESPSRRPLTAETEGSMNWQIIEHDNNETSGSGTGSSNGRISPTKTDDRTSSTLSERSQRSMTSTTSITRTMSTRTSAVLAAALARREADQTAATTPMEALRTATMTTSNSSNGRKSPYYFQGSHGDANTNTKIQSSRPRSRHQAEKSTDSFMTASSTFADLQSQGQALLGGQPHMDRDDPYRRALAAQGSSGKSRAPDLDPLQPPTRRQGWMGSLRRALTAMSNERSFSLTSQNKQPVSPEEIEPCASMTSSTRVRGKPVADEGPRRTVSDGGALLKQKRGQKDWQEAPIARDLDAGDWGEPRSSLEAKQAEGEWDVEGEASRRDVQMMFTVPKARLRVVNADIERASMRSASDGAVSRKGSLANLKRENSVNTMRSRSDGEGGHKERQRLMLGPTKEEQETAASSGVRLGWL
ncbi:hypothetical protein AC579_9719 [Pseudocercospora musae]|uniref:Galactose oxidase n=1 Tax=Pseudocercospora musae TaxID=113226 RepID=A0A139HZF3_9PEZI|nr:hypothetical protein AC579_9719 [Pseudocercospora musae]